MLYPDHPRAEIGTWKKLCREIDSTGTVQIFCEKYVYRLVNYLPIMYNSFTKRFQHGKVYDIWKM